MPSFLIANPKGGSGKSTFATQLAGYFAKQGQRVMLGDLDSQQSVRSWLALRPSILPKIRYWDIADGVVARPPKGTTHVVLDSPAGLQGKALQKVIKKVDRIIVPIQPSLFDRLAAQQFFEALHAEKAVRKEKVFVALVAMRVDPRTRAAAELVHFLDAYDFPVLSHIRDTQLYVQLIAKGMSLFDLSATRAARDLEEWQPIVNWLEEA